MLAVAIDRGKLDSRERKPGDERLLEGGPSHATRGLKGGDKPAAHSFVTLVS